MTMKFIENIFYNLIGNYSIRRILSNQGTGEGTAHFIGYDPIKQHAASQSSNKNIVLYREELNINYYNNKSMVKASRKYLYILRQNTIIKYFYDDNDNSLFYQMYFTSVLPVKAEGIHQCNLDTYIAHYIFYNSDRFNLNYNVLGPYKNYTIQTSYTRINKT